MKIPISIIAILIIFSSCKESVDTTAFLKEGVTLELEEYRSEQISDLKYELSFSIPEKKEEPVISKLVLKLNLKDLNAPLFLDFKEETSKLKSLSVNGKSTEIDHQKEHLIIPVKALKVGANTIDIDFIMGELSLNRNEEYLYTLLVPDRARTLIPCFDQPNLKANYKLTITAPKDWKVLCAAPEISSKEQGDFTEHRFGESEKMSSYLFSFVAGKFNTEVMPEETFDMHLLYRENDSTKISLSVPAIFDLHQQSISYLKDYTNFPFPFQKLDYAAIPAFQYGGMEHVGAIQYREGSLFLDESATENQKLSRAKLIAHETSHMWFGDLVTMDWFNDVWMKEVFANFMADKIVNPAFPDINHDLAFMLTHYPRAYGEDRTLGTNPIRQNLENLNDAGSLYGSIIYNKAPIMMRQLETTMGKPAFKKGIQNYIKKYEYGNAVWNDLVALLDAETEKDLNKWSEIWVNRSSRPIFTDDISYAQDGTIKSFEITQKAEDESDGIWPQTFDISLVYPDSTQSITVDIVAQQLLLEKAKGLPKPDAIIYNSNGLGYGVFPINAGYLPNISSIKDEVTRGYAYINGYENTLNGSISATSLFQLYQESLLVEKNELLVNLVSSYLNTIFWTYLNAKERAKIQPELERQLLQQLQSDLPANIKKTLFGTFRAIAYSDSGKNTLYAIWNKELKIKDLKLNTDDRTAIALQLAVFGYKGQMELLETAKTEITNPDKLKRFEFLLPAVSNDVSIRDAFFESLKDEKNRAKESWVLGALTYLNHPLRQETSINYLKPSLELLDEIQKTGDIFFPKRWLSSTIGGYTSPEAYSIMKDFIAENPDLNPALLKKLLQASDDLRRVQLLQKG